MKAEVVKMGALSLQVCVPEEWTDEMVTLFANQEVPCGTESGWHIRKEGSKLLGGDSERQPCSTRAGMVHIMLDA